MTLGNTLISNWIDTKSPLQIVKSDISVTCGVKWTIGQWIHIPYKARSAPRGQVCPHCCWPCDWPVHYGSWPPCPSDNPWPLKGHSYPLIPPRVALVKEQRVFQTLLTNMLGPRPSHTLDGGPQFQLLHPRTPPIWPVLGRGCSHVTCDEGLAHCCWKEAEEANYNRWNINFIGPQWSEPIRVTQLLRVTILSIQRSLNSVLLWD